MISAVVSDNNKADATVFLQQLHGFLVLLAS